MRARAVGVATMALWATASLPASAAGPSTTLLISQPTGLGPLPEPGDGFTRVSPNAISGDGRFVVFLSGADDLGVRDRSVHAWIRDSLTDTTRLVDRVPADDEPGNGFVNFAAISRDGSTVCFVGNATNLVPGVSGLHVFVVTLSSGAIALADRGTGAAGAVANETPSRCALDGAGTRVVFDSRANNLVPSDTNAATDVFVRDLGASSTTRVSVNSMGVQVPNGGFQGVISADGLSVAFATSDALISGDTLGLTDVYVRNLQAATLVRASVGTGSVEANDSSSEPAIDDTGGHVAFTSAATNLDGFDTNSSRDVFWRDLTGSDTTVLVSRGSSGGPIGDEDSERPAISGDGLGVAFDSAATNLGAGVPAQGRLVYLHRLGTSVTSLLSRASGAAGAPANAAAVIVSLGSTPTVAAWTSSGSNLTPDASGEFGGVFKYDLPVLTTTLVSRPTGTGPRSAAVNDSFVFFRATSGDGHLVVFQSLADGLDPAAAGPHFHIFVRDIVTGATTLVSRAAGPSGVVANGASFAPAINAAGTHVVFRSDATNLVDGVTTPQVYVRDLATGAIEVASRTDGAAGMLAMAVSSGPMDISADGRRVAFTADDPLVSEDTNTRSDVYVRDLVTGATLLASVGAGGTAGNGDSFSPSLSDDGMRVAFSSQARDLLADLVPGFKTHVYVRDLGAGTTVLADRQAADGTPGVENAVDPELSGAGNRVAFIAGQPLTAETVPSAGALYVRDLATDTTLLAGREDGPAGAAVSLIGGYSINRDGTRVSFGAFGTGGADQTQVFVRDLDAGTTVLASAADGTAATVSNGDAFGNSLSAGGGCVAFSSSADNLVTPGYPTSDFLQVYLRVVDGECPELPTTTSTTLPPSAQRPIPARAVVVRPGRLVKLVARGLSGNPADPTVAGAILDVVGTTGSAGYALPASGWKAVGQRTPKGFKFKGDDCRVLLRERRIRALCRGNTGGLRLPEPGPLDVVLTIAGGAAYCAACGGREAGRPARVFKRKRCAAPTTCP